MQLSFALLLCLIDLKTEQQERDDRISMFDAATGLTGLKP